MNSQSVAQASLVPDGNRHSGRYLLRRWQQGTTGGGAEYLDDFLPENKRLSPQVRTSDVDYSGLRKTLSTSSTSGRTSIIVIATLTPFEDTRGKNKFARAFTRFSIRTGNRVQCLERKLKRGSFAPRNDVSFEVHSVNFSNGVRSLQTY